MYAFIRLGFVFQKLGHIAQDVVVVDETIASITTYYVAHESLKTSVSFVAAFSRLRYFPSQLLDKDLTIDNIGWVIILYLARQLMW